ncbi:NAD(P)-binding domain-containing protein [Cyclobacterium xiamenense]|uniref:NAD(P)-binding domain-containing protein n=1 Tax=Cyclobacterium xiamenense TaxID=1297121 RepID=UPI0035CE971B
MNIAILGDSSLARNLGYRYMNRGINVVFGVKRNYTITDIAWKIYNKNSDKVLPYPAAIAGADLVFICCETQCLPGICDSLLQARDPKKIIVDCTNGTYEEENGGDAFPLMEKLGTKNLYKAFNNLGLDYPLSDPLGIIQETYFCGENNENKTKLKKWIELAGFKAIDAGEYDSARLLEAFYQLKLKIARQQQQQNKLCHFKLISH